MKINIHLTSIETDDLKKSIARDLAGSETEGDISELIGSGPCDSDDDSQEDSPEVRIRDL